MIKGIGKEVVVVVVFTGYADGTVDFIQDAPRKNAFEAVKTCFKAMMHQLQKNLKNEAKCPFSPRNPQVLEYLEGGLVAHMPEVKNNIGD